MTLASILVSHPASSGVLCYLLVCFCLLLYVSWLHGGLCRGSCRSSVNSRRSKSWQIALQLKYWVWWCIHIPWHIQYGGALTLWVKVLISGLWHTVVAYAERCRKLNDTYVLVALKRYHNVFDGLLRLKSHEGSADCLRMYKCLVHWHGRII